MISSVEKIYTLTGFHYLMTTDNGDVWSVPNDEANSDYQAIQEWIAEGNTVIDNPPE
jgi:hypothetical protein